MTTETTTIWLDPAAIEPNPFNPRKHFSEQEIAELAASINEQGLLQPILVRPVKGRKHKHQIVLGERRWRAIQLLEWHRVQVNVRPMSDFESLQAALAENIQREDLTDYEEAGGLQAVIEQAEKQGNRLSVSGLMKMFGKSETYIRNRLGLFSLKPDVQEMTQRHRLVLSSAYKINKVADAETRQELIEMVDAGASFKAIESRIERIEADKAWQRESQAPDAATRKAVRSQTQRTTEAEKRARECLDEAERQLINAATWLPNVPAKTRNAALSGQIERIERRVKELRG